MRVFERVDLYAHLGKTKYTPCTSGFIWYQMGKYYYKGWATGEGTNFWERKRVRVSCDKCKR